MHSPDLPSRRRRAAPFGVAVVALITGVMLVVLLLSPGSSLHAPDADGPAATTADRQERAAVPAFAAAGSEAADGGAPRASLLASADVEVRVVDEADRPVEGATVQLSADFGASPGAVPDPALTAVTDAGGRA